MNNFRLLEPIRQMIVGQMWLVENILEIYDYCLSTDCPELEYIDDLPFYEYISNQLSQYNQKLRKKNREFIKEVIESIKEVIESECQTPADYLETLSLNLNDRLATQKKIHLELIKLAPNLDSGSIDRLNQQVVLFQSKFFGRRDLGVDYQKNLDALNWRLSIDKNDSLLKKSIGRSLDKGNQASFEQSKKRV